MNEIDDLEQRGMIQDIMPGTKELLGREKIAAYVGVDPTADSMHVGNLATIMLLKYLQHYGHTPVALVGGATGMIGDPSGKSAERNLLDEATLKHNQAGVAKQMQNILGESNRILKREDHFFTEENLDQKIFSKKVQEYYSLRCVPQILGPVLDTINNCAQVLEDELNSANDNPIVSLSEQNVLHGGNFHGDYISLEMDKLKMVCIHHLRARAF